MSFDHKQFKKLRDNFQGLINDYDKFLDNFITIEGNKCLADTKRNTPVDTGALRARWNLSRPVRMGNTREIYIHNSVYYALWVEEGHRIVNQYGEYGWHPGRHMGRIALVRAQNRLPANFDIAFRNFCAGKGI